MKILTIVILALALSGCASRENLKSALDAVRDSDEATLEYHRSKDGRIHYRYTQCKGDMCDSGGDAK